MSWAEKPLNPLADATGRENVIVTRNREYINKDCTVLHSMNEVKQFADASEQEVFVIGGAEIFKGILPVADRLYLTEIHASFEGDTYFPTIDEKEWRQVLSTPGIVDEKNKYAHQFIVLERV